MASGAGQRRVVVLRRPAASGESQEAQVAPESLEFVWLAHPRTGKRCAFALAGGELLEVQRVGPRQPASWLIDQSVASDGGMLLVSPFDPRFLLLPLLERSRDKLIPIAQVLAEARGCGMNALNGVKKLPEMLEAICTVDRSLGDDLVVVKLDEAKASAWLCDKVKRVSVVLSKQASSAPCQQGSVSQFNLAKQQAAEGGAATSTSSDSGVGPQHVKTATALVSEYLCTEWAGRLRLAFESDLAAAEDAEQAATAGASRLLTTSDVFAKYSARRSSSGEPDPAQQKEAELTMAQKRLAKTNTRGMNSISSFFTKKVTPPKTA